MLTLLATTPLALSSPNGGVAGAGAEPERPNVLIVVTDDQRFDMQGREMLPNIRRIFGDEGVQYKNGVVTTPLCCPSRASIFSGKYVHNHGLSDNSPSDEGWDSSATMQNELQQAGYFTAISGKYFKAWGEPEYMDRWAVQLRPDVVDYYDSRWNINGVGRQRTPIHSTKFAGLKAVDFLEEFETADDTAPWFMQISPLSPHKPWTPLKQHRSDPVVKWNLPPSIGESVTDKPAYLLDRYTHRPKKSAGIHKKMLRSLKGVDVVVKRVYEWLEEHGEADNTLAFFVSDNGYMLGEHGLLIRKQVPYEESVRIPFFVRWPERLLGGTVEESIAANIDIAPTVYEAAGVDPDYVVDGRSLLSGPERSQILLESEIDSRWGTPAWSALWSPESTYVRYDTGEREFYDNVLDPYQLKNLLGNSSRKDDPPTEPLDAALTTYSTCAGSTCP